MKFKIGDKVRFQNGSETMEIKGVKFNVNNEYFYNVGDYEEVSERFLEEVKSTQFTIRFKNDIIIKKEADIIIETETQYKLKKDNEIVAIISKSEILYMIKK